MKLDDLNRLLYNPAWTGRLLHFFISGASGSKSQKIKFELLYLAHPFLYDEVILNRLVSSTKRTSLSSLLRDEKIRLRLIGMASKVESFREITNKSIVSSGSYIEFCEGGYVRSREPLDYSKYGDLPELRPYFKAAQNLGLILAKEKHLEVLLKIGV
jgi:hypothetical protein